MKVLWAIAIITLKEGTRSRAFYGVSILALVLTGANLVISGIIPQEMGKVATDMALSTVSFSGLLLVIFIGFNLLAKDLDKKTVYAILSRPVSRTEYILGRFLGISMLLTAAIFFVSLISFFFLLAMKAAYPAYFPRFSVPLLLLSVLLITLSHLVLLSLSLLFASFSSTSFLTLMLTIAAYLIGQSLADIKEIVETSQSIGMSVSPIIAAVVRCTYYLFPNLAIFDIKVQAAHGLPVSSGYIVWSLAYGVVYTCLALLFASLIFRKKEFP